ncbi:MAG: hypothetical protein ABJA20_04175 [Novosphingobium sp.]
MVAMSRIVRRLTRGALVFGGLAAISGAALADGYINSGDSWLAMTPEAKMAYVQGVNDTSNFIYVNDDLATAIVKVARTRCLIESKTTPNILADIITNAYTKQPALKVRPPMLIYVLRMGEICRPIINQERTRMGLPAL